MSKNITITREQLSEIIAESLRRNLQETYLNENSMNEDFRGVMNAAKKGALALGLAGTMASCGNGVWYGNTPDNPTQTEVSYKDQQYAKFDWSLITDEENQGFIYDMYTGCANSGSRHIACIIQKDKYCWRYYVPKELEEEIGEKYRNKEVVDIRQLEPFIGWRGYN